MIEIIKKLWKYILMTFNLTAPGDIQNPPSSGGGGGGGGGALYVAAAGGEQVITLDVDLDTDKHYRGFVACTNNVNSTRSMQVRLNGTIIIAYLGAATRASPSGCFFEIGLVDLPDGQRYFAYRSQVPTAGLTCAWSPIQTDATNLTTIDLYCTLAGGIGDGSFIHVMKG